MTGGAAYGTAAADPCFKAITKALGDHPAVIVCLDMAALSLCRLAATTDYISAASARES
jgi:hypothetical protein